jgi:hypothetical protein
MLTDRAFTFWLVCFLAILGILGTLLNNIGFIWMDLCGNDGEFDGRLG